MHLLAPSGAFFMRVISILLRIEAPHFVAGAESNLYGEILRAEPIIKYMEGWDAEKTRLYCMKKRWFLSRIPIYGRSSKHLGCSGI